MKVYYFDRITRFSTAPSRQHRGANMQIDYNESRGVPECVVSGLRLLEDDGVRVSRDWPSLIATLCIL